VLSLTAAAIFWLLCASSATAQNLIVNGDFNTGDLSGWTITPEAPTTLTYDNGTSNPAGSASRRGHLHRQPFGEYLNTHDVVVRQQRGHDQRLNSNLDKFKLRHPTLYETYP
jgi:hypothetical protein